MRIRYYKSTLPKTTIPVYRTDSEGFWQYAFVTAHKVTWVDSCNGARWLRKHLRPVRLRDVRHLLR